MYFELSRVEFGYVSCTYVNSLNAISCLVLQLIAHLNACKEHSLIDKTKSLIDFRIYDTLLE